MIQKMRLLRTKPCVSPLTALTLKTFGPDMAQFMRGRDFVAWLGFWGFQALISFLVLCCFRRFLLNPQTPKLSDHGETNASYFFAAHEQRKAHRRNGPEC